MDRAIFHVVAKWDSESRTWVAESAEVPGLVTGASSKEELSKKVDHLVPACFSVSGKPLPSEYEVKIVFDNAEGG